MPQRQVAAALDRCGLHGDSVLVAVSGGVDSMALLHLLLRLAPRYALTLSVGHVDHGLRGEASDADARFVEELAQGLGLPVAVERIEPGALREGGSSRSRPTLQEASRELRYEALARLADTLGAGHIATAHNADDQAETLLLRLLRGCGPDALGGIPERSPDGRTLRPLLGVSRAAIERYACDHGLRWREDASNASDAYARNRLRAHWLPGLAKDFNPRLLRTLGDLAETCRTDAEWIAEAVAEEARSRFRRTEEGLEIDSGGWNALPEGLARRLARHALVEMGGGRDLSRAHVLRVVAFLRASTSDGRGTTLELPAGLRLERRPGSYLLKREPGWAGAGC